MSSKAMHQNLPTVDGAVTSVRQPLTELAGQAKSADPAPLLVPDQTNAQLKTDIRGSHELADALAAGTEKNATRPTAAATSDLSASNDKGVEGSDDQAIFDPASSETASAASVTDAPTLAGAPATAAEIAGTGVATTDLPMKDPEEKNKVAGPGVKVLPVDDKDDAAENNLPPQVGAAVAHGSEGNGHLDLGFGSSPDQASGEANARILSSMDLPSLADARLRALDRTNDMLVLHSMRLEESKLDSLSVVIKPAIGMELALELHQSGDGVEAQATVLRGDHNFLSEHWGDLQQRLEQRGIKLSALNCEAGFSTNDNGQFQPPQTSPEDMAQQASAFAEFAATTAGGGASARLATVHDGWESWA
jgi:hypothetical protein